ncbi:MAG: PAS domain S-box protein, partial [Gallionella sp.]|nr:PAS domain S-box protein [Gallionella sp.]
MINEVNSASLDILDRVFGEAAVVFFTAAADEGYALVFVSRNIGRVLGMRHESCVETAAFWRERVHTDDIGRVLREFSGLAETGSATLEFRLRDDLGSYRWVSSEVACRREPNGNPDYLAGCLRDVSEAKNREIEFANNLKEQNAREHFYRSVLDSVPQRLFWKDRNSVFRGCNLSGARALNLSDAGEIAGKTDYDFYPDRNEANYLRLNDERVMNSDQPSFHTETPAREKDTWLDVTKVPLRDENGEVYGLLVSYEDVSALKKSEMALHKFKRAVEQSPNSIFIADVAGNIEHVNPSFLSAYGYGINDVLGKNLSQMKSEVIPHDNYAQMWQSVMGGKSWKDELEYYSRAGEILWKACSFSPIFDETGRIIHLLGIENNITERKRMEKALAENEARLREITSTVGEGIYVVDMNDIITFVNPAAARLFGWSEQELLFRDARCIFNCCRRENMPESDARTCCMFDEVKQSRAVVRSEKEFFLRKDGMQFPASVIAAPILRGDRYDGAVVAFHDITERKLTQKLLSDTLHELRTVLDNAQIGVAYLRGNQFFWINRHMEQMFGYVAGELMGKQMGAIYAMEANELDAYIGEINGLLAKGGVYENELLMKRSTGEVFWCHQRAAAIEHVDPGKGSIWIMLDIDRLKKTENNLKALNETLAQRVAEETQKSLERERLLIQQGRNAAMGEMIG